MSVLRFLRTVRHLKARQWIGQTRERVRVHTRDPARLIARVPDDGAAPVIGWNPVVPWIAPDGTPFAADALRAGSLSMLGITRSVGSPPSWDQAEAPRLWRYHLHYHGFLFALEFAEARAWVRDYMESHGPVRGVRAQLEGWEPYPLSQRLMTWLPLFFGRWRARTCADAAFAARLWLEVRRMVDWLEEHLETHLMANHLLENAVAISLAGACFEGECAAAWRGRGYALLEEQLDEQILADGGHYERSPMYQQRVLYALAALVNTGDTELGWLCREPASRMAGWLEAMTHPDGGIALFNDAALGLHPETSKLREWLGRMDVEPLRSEGEAGALMPSGYFAVRDDSGDALFMDAAEIGPDHQPGHAHADFLAIEVSFAHMRFIVDGGNHDYEPSRERAWARSVEAHSTVYVDGEEPLELWGAFRVGRRGRPIDVACDTRADGARVFRARHTGYRHLRGSPVPSRRVVWSGGTVEVADAVEARAARACTSQLRVDGAWRLERVAPKRLRFTRGATEVWVVGGSEIEVSASRWFPRFGTVATAHLLRQRTASGPDPLPVRWILQRGTEPRGQEAGAHA
ncbi:MAG: hypothetical protein GY711_16030 [bacterium]|nr:hypothetical protein [bacterium]